ncbi:MAG TPA: ABC transporter permease [Gemmatimonadaceae bacterium]|nr:ABC transporter permease [Gemmatimonadaceae bacterium]
MSTLVAPDPNPASSLRDLANSRELLWSFVRRDLIVRYRNAVLGVSWAVASPLLQMVIFAVIFTRIVRVETGLPYPLFAYSGLVAWSLTASALRAATTSLSGNSLLVTKVYFRREVLPLSAVIVAFADFCVALLLVGVMMAYYGIPLPATSLFLIVVIAVQLAFTIGLALMLAAANLFWNDVRYAFELLVNAWMFATAVLYPADLVTGRLGLVFRLNPMTPIVEAYRDVLLRGTLPSPAGFGWAMFVAIAVLFAGIALFRRSEPRFAEVA